MKKFSRERQTLTTPDGSHDHCEAKDKTESRKADNMALLTL